MFRKRSRRSTVVALSAAFASCAVLASMAASRVAAQGPAQGSLSAETVIVTLGTAGGPRPREDRGASANLLVVRGVPYLIDAGEGTIRQIARAKVDFRSIGNIFITHNHSDHTLGLPALLATQWEFQRREPVTVHGPLGTQALVSGLLSFLAINSTIRAEEGNPTPIDRMIRTNEAQPGVIFRDSNVTVTAVENNHYHFAPGTAPFGKHKSFSYRFDTPGRSVVFTGDTGPSPALERLAKGADVLVSEVLLVGDLLAYYKSNGQWGRKSPQEQRDWLRHQTDEHMAPEAVAALATSAGVKQVLLTHFPPSGIPGDDYERWASAVRKGFAGKVVAAKDLDRF